MKKSEKETWDNDALLEVAISTMSDEEVEKTLQAYDFDYKPCEVEKSVRPWYKQFAKKVLYRIFSSKKPGINPVKVRLERLKSN